MSEALPSTRSASGGLRLRGPLADGHRAVLSPEALRFLAGLERRFGARRRELLADRAARQARLDAGERPDFLPETAALRAGDWKVAPAPADLAQRLVEITGPVDRKMVINALNSGADVYMADFEDSNAPTWDNNVQGQINLRDAVRGTIEFTSPDTGKRYVLAERTAVLLVRPRGLHLEERHVELDGRPLSASLFDFALYLFHNHAALRAKGTGPYFYLPKLESHREARWWNDVFCAAQDELGIPRGTIKATVLIETILAAFEMHEILWELREHSAGLNCGRWDYIFSFIKKFRADPAFVLPDRGTIGMERHFLRSYSQLLIQTCHRRGAHAMGGMAAQIPIKSDAAKNARALDKVRADKRREAGDGHDGTWVAHPALVALAREEFATLVHGQNQLARLREDVHVTAADLLAVPDGARTDAGLRQNLNVGLQYLEAWLSGTGCVPLYDLMEDAATAEISRTQVWQWVRHGARLADGTRVDAALVRRTLQEELSAIRSQLGERRFEDGRFRLAAELFERLILSERLEEFLTLPAYDHIVTLSDNRGPA